MHFQFSPFTQGLAVYFGVKYITLGIATIWNRWKHVNEGRVDQGFCELQKEPPINPYLDGVLMTSYRVHTQCCTVFQPCNNASLFKTVGYCLRGGVNNSVYIILKGVREGNQFWRYSFIIFRNHHLNKTCVHHMNMKLCTVCFQIGNSEFPSVSKSPIPFLEKNINWNINESVFSYK